MPGRYSRRLGWGGFGTQEPVYHAPWRINPGPTTPRTDFASEFAKGQIGSPRDWMLPDTSPGADPGIYREDNKQSIPRSMVSPGSGQILRDPITIPFDTAQPHIFAGVDDGGVMPSGGPMKFPSLNDDPARNKGANINASGQINPSYMTAVDAFNKSLYAPADTQQDKFAAPTLAPIKTPNWKGWQAPTKTDSYAIANKYGGYQAVVDTGGNSPDPLSALIRGQRTIAAPPRPTVNGVDLPYA
jgi:hypothetical protein